MPSKHIYRRCRSCGNVDKDYDFYDLKLERSKENYLKRECTNCGQQELDMGTEMKRMSKDLLAGSD